MMYLYPLVVEDAGASLPCMFNAIMVWWLNVTWKHKSAAVQVFSTTLSMTPKMTTRSRHALLTPRMVHDCEEEKRGGGLRTVTHSAPDRTDCGRPAGARGFVFHPFFLGDQLWSECAERWAQWCCCYKYASTSVSKWQLYSGPRTHCLGTVRASESKKGKPTVRALVDMYLCTLQQLMCDV